MPFTKSAGAVIFYRSGEKIEYLLLKHNDTYWNFPKGTLEKGEMEIETTKREIKEETGLINIKIIPGFKTWEKYFYRAPKDYRKIELRGKVFFKVVNFYLAESKTKDVKISFEHQGYEWLEFKEAMERLKKYKSSQKILKKANEFFNESIKLPPF